MLCSQLDVEQRLQAAFDNNPEPVVAALIIAAQGHMERVAERKLEADDYTELHDGSRLPVLVANPPINTLTSVTVDGTLLTVDTDYIHYPEAGRIQRISDGYPVTWGTFRYQGVEVIYNGGFTDVPPDLRDICAWAAARAFQVGAANANAPAGSEGVKSITLEGSDSVTYRDLAEFTAHVALTEYEIDAIRSGSFGGVPYRIPSVG